MDFEFIISIIFVVLKMKEYDLIAIGTGSAMGIVDAMINQNPLFDVNF